MSCRPCLVWLALAAAVAGSGCLDMSVPRESSWATLAEYGYGTEDYPVVLEAVALDPSEPLPSYDTELTDAVLDGEVLWIPQAEDGSLESFGLRAVYLPPPQYGASGIAPALVLFLAGGGGTMVVQVARNPATQRQLQLLGATITTVILAPLWKNAAEPLVDGLVDVGQDMAARVLRWTEAMQARQVTLVDASGQTRVISRELADRLRQNPVCPASSFWVPASQFVGITATQDPTGVMCVAPRLVVGTGVNWISFGNSTPVPAVLTFEGISTLPDAWGHRRARDYTVPMTVPPFGTSMIGPIQAFNPVTLVNVALGAQVLPVAIIP